MKVKTTSIIGLISILMLISCQSNAQTYTIRTGLGNIRVKLYDSTPLHKANFEKLVTEHAYDSVLFHRIIQGFMIQTGDLTTKPDTRRLSDDERQTIPAEFVAENFHKKGALAAARTGDQVNPEKRSSPTQFYIVQGRVYSDEELSRLEQVYGKSWTPEQKEMYTTLGGTPFLDRDYTVYGEVVDGLDIVDAIAALPTGPRDFPLSDIRIISVERDE